MGQRVWVAANGTELHGRRDCRSLAGASRVDELSSTTRRVGMFDPCRRCLPDAPLHETTMAWASVRAALRDRPPSTRERLRVEAARRGVTYQAWATRFIEVNE